MSIVPKVKFFPSAEISEKSLYLVFCCSLRRYGIHSMATLIKIYGFNFITISKKKRKNIYLQTSEDHDVARSRHLFLRLSFDWKKDIALFHKARFMINKEKFYSPLNKAHNVKVELQLERLLKLMYWDAGLLKRLWLLWIIMCFKNFSIFSASFLYKPCRRYLISSFKNHIWIFIWFSLHNQCRSLQYTANKTSGLIVR